jgi:hypothetical protein
MIVLFDQFYLFFFWLKKNQPLGLWLFIIEMTANELGHNNTKKTLLFVIW